MSEAVAEIKECKMKITHRDRQLEEYVQMINQLELKVNEQYDQVEDLRERLGLGPQEPLDTSKFINKKAKRMQEDRALNKLLQTMSVSFSLPLSYFVDIKTSLSVNFFFLRMFDQSQPWLAAKWTYPAKDVIFFDGFGVWDSNRFCVWPIFLSSRSAGSIGDI